MQHPQLVHPAAVKWWNPPPHVAKEVISHAVRNIPNRLMKITKARIGRSFSVQLLRILYAMSKRDVIESAKEVSQKLLHSQEQSLQYAKKD